MSWSGKVLGGLVGGMVGGPIGLGVGAALGHYLADGADGARDLRVIRLEWTHHAFSASGPGVRVTPVWTAKRHAGRDVRVRILANGRRQEATVVPDEDAETCAIPDFFVGYGGYADDGDPAFDGRVAVTLDSSRGAAQGVTFEVDLPSPVRRLGLSGPARLVMALAACARAGGRPLERGDVRFVRETFTSSLPLDDEGRRWLRAWLRTLRDADLARLAPEKVAARLERHLADHADDPEGGLRLDAVLLWLMRGAREAWPGEAQEAWISAFAAALGCDAPRLTALWEELDAEPEDTDASQARMVLGVAAGATPDEIRAAWRRLVLQYHPDRARTPEQVAEATRRMSEINAAYRVLREAGIG